MVKVVVFLAAAAGALNFGSKPTTAGTTPAAFKPAFGNPAQIAQRAAARLAKQEECKKDLIPTPGRFLFAFGRPDVLAARQAERCAKWEWSSAFLATARPDKAGGGIGRAHPEYGPRCAPPGRANGNDAGGSM